MRERILKVIDELESIIKELSKNHETFLKHSKEIIAIDKCLKILYSLID